MKKLLFILLLSSVLLSCAKERQVPFEIKILKETGEFNSRGNAIVESNVDQVYATIEFYSGITKIKTIYKKVDNGYLECILDVPKSADVVKVIGYHKATRKIAINRVMIDSTLIRTALLFNAEEYRYRFKARDGYDVTSTLILPNGVMIKSDDWGIYHVHKSLLNEMSHVGRLVDTQGNERYWRELPLDDENIVDLLTNEL